MSDEHTPSVSPYLYYVDGVRAVDFLCGAFGMEERSRNLRRDGTLHHAEVTLGDGVIMLGTPQDADRVAALRDSHEHDSSVFCYVEDVAGHYARARDAGAEIVSEPEDQGYGEVYAAADPEGRKWYFCSTP
jgi:uncharacterized glyoxalase superfamily protein PhnB